MARKSHTHSNKTGQHLPTAHGSSQHSLSTKKGGTAIIIPFDSIELEKSETIHDAVTRIRNSASRTACGRVTSLTTKIHSRQIRLTAAYAHSDAQADQRPGFFTNTLKPRLTQNTVLGIDANCVPDEQLDLKRVGVHPYNNTGANELADAISHNGSEIR